jgi:type IV pilus assembly protein PilC
MKNHTHPAITIPIRVANKQSGITEIAQPLTRREFHLFPQRIKAMEMTQLIRQLATLVSMRLTLEHSLRLLGDQQSNKKLQAILQDCRQRLVHGSGFADICDAHPDVFPKTLVHFIRIGEMTGKLGDCLNQAALQQEKVMRIKRKITSALAYRAIILAVAAAAVIFLLVAVVPTFTEVFREFGGELPAATRLLLAVSDFLSQYGFYLLLMLLVSPKLGLEIWKKPSARRRLEKIIYRLPWAGPVILKTHLARFLRILFAMLENGIHLTTAVPAAGEASSSLSISDSSAELTRRIISGVSLHAAMNADALFPSLIVRMVQVGEETGALPQMLAVSAQYYEEEIDAAIETMNAVIEPLLIVGLGLVLGAILIAMYMQLFSVVDVVR